MQIKYTNTISAKDGVKHVNFGPSGVGKTRLIRTAPRPFIFNAEKGLLSMRKEKLPYTDIFSYKDLVDAYTWAMKSNETKNFDTFALDSASEISEVLLKEYLDKTKDPRKAYGNMQQDMYEIIRNFRDLPNKNVYFVAKQITVVEGVEPSQYKVNTPIMPSEKLQAQLPYFFDLVTNHATQVFDGVDYEILRCRAGKTWHAKDRSGNLAEIEEPNLTKLYQKASA